MDSAFCLPGTGIRFELDPVIGLIQGLGDTVMLLIGGRHAPLWPNASNSAQP